MYKKKQYDARTNAALERQVLEILSKSDTGLSLQDIAAAIGKEITWQKVNRVLTEVNKFFPILKEKSRYGHMTYKLKSIHEEQGYDVNRFDEKGNVKATATYMNPGDDGWIAPRFRYLYDKSLGE